MDSVFFFHLGKSLDIDCMLLLQRPELIDSKKLDGAAYEWENSKWKKYTNCVFFSFFPHSKVKIALVKDHLQWYKTFVPSDPLACLVLELFFFWYSIWSGHLLGMQSKNDIKSKDTSILLQFDCLIFDLLHSFIKSNNAEEEKNVCL